MIDKETYKSELIRMLDSHRTKHKGEHTCVGVKCEECQLYDVGCGNALYVYETIEAVEKWSKEHQPKKFKVSRFEYDTLKSCIECLFYGRFFEHELLMKLLKKGYFQGAKDDTYIYEYLNNCEVVADDY